MNYIKHLNNFYNKIQIDKEIAPSQIAMYLALFQCWNKQRFENPIYIIRDEIMRLSKITSKSTYHRSMRILHENGYIIYEPSYNPYMGSRIYFQDLSNGFNTKPIKNKAINKSTNHTKPINNNVIDNPMINPMTTPVEPLYKHVNNKRENNKLSLCRERKISEIIFDKNNSKKFNLLVIDNLQKEKSSAKKEKGSIPTLDEVLVFFNEKKGSEIEAEKFFNYFESNGWLVGGKTKMKKWKAAAANWVINSNQSNLKLHNTQKPLDTSKNKRYDEPL